MPRSSRTKWFIAALLSATALATDPSAAQPRIPASTQPAPASQPEPIDPLEQFESAIQSLIERTSPAVVAIQGQLYPGAANPRLAADHSALVGSGFIIRADGMILTCEHVIRDARILHAALSDGRRFRARLLAADPRADLAVLQIDAENLPVFDFADGPPTRRGQFVLAFGHPAGLPALQEPAVVQGLVSAVARALPESFGEAEDRYYGDMIHVGAALGPGCSGGPLIDRRGRLIGVISAVTTAAHESAGLGFAIPITPRTRRVIEQLLRGQTVEYGYLGVRVTDARLEADGKSAGVALAAVLTDGPAQRIGLRPGDVLTHLDDARIAGAEEFIQSLGARGPDADVRLTLLRDNGQSTHRVRLARRLPARSPARPRQGLLHGATLAELDESVRLAGNLPDSALIVVMVDAGSAAHEAGLSPGDIVIRLDGRPISIPALETIHGDCLLGLATGGALMIKAAP